MARTTHISLLAMTALLASGCSTKPCHCYVLERWGSVFESITYVSERHRCSELGYNTVHPLDSTFRLCTEIEEPDLDSYTIVDTFWNNHKK